MLSVLRVLTFPKPGGTPGGAVVVKAAGVANLFRSVPKSANRYSAFTDQLSAIAGSEPPPAVQPNIEVVKCVGLANGTITPPLVIVASAPECQQPRSARPSRR